MAAALGPLAGAAEALPADTEPAISMAMLLMRAEKEELSTSLLIKMAAVAGPRTPQQPNGSGYLSGIDVDADSDTSSTAAWWPAAEQQLQAKGHAAHLAGILATDKTQTLE